MTPDGFLRRLQAKHNLTPSECSSGDDYYEIRVESAFDDGVHDSKVKGTAVNSHTSNGGTNAASSRATLATTNFGNDYTDHFIHTGSLPQSHITNRRAPQEGYPKLKELHSLKAQQVQAYANPPYSIKCPSGSAMNERLLSLLQRNGVQFDVVLVSAEGGMDRKLLLDLPIAKITPRPSLCFAWVPGSEGWLESAREMLEKWGFRRSEDIVYIPSSENDAYYPQTETYNIFNYGNDEREIFQQSTWHCLMGLKGTLRRNQDSDLIHCNVDTDVILGQEENTPKKGNNINVIPEQIYTIIENFSLMSRRIHIVPGQCKQSSTTISRKPLPRRGWVIMGPSVLEDNFEPEKYVADLRALGNKVPVNPHIENLRPKTPPGMGGGGGRGRR
ncbi:hypothetical protein NADFUDRAFT_53731 [Nadsonia fulvescens var. elongata DSM 6958]|uniref:Karyogamy protein KAR4 n=1 Tax=Nadsonia fulvescens var. elongata DSM 6958 TaxID=857566 RepID=A0A1E3PCD3_9ASCO|nr:hypothetical protein NADFUDRAFT_53731 [Nadsonia fulvescens var. elongata DSM 6958]